MAKFKRKYIKEIIEYCSKGSSVESFAAEVLATRGTIDKWAKENPKFMEAMEIAQLKSLQFWENELLNPDTEISKSFITYVLTKRYNDVYNEKKEQKQIDEPINITFKVKDDRKND